MPKHSLKKCTLVQVHLVKLNKVKWDNEALIESKPIELKVFKLSSKLFQMLLEASAAVNQMSVFAVLR